MRRFDNSHEIGFKIGRLTTIILEYVLETMNK